MARRLTRWRKATGTRGRLSESRATAGAAKPRRWPQLLAWAFVLAVFTGMAALSGSLGTGGGSRSPAAAVAAVGGADASNVLAAPASVLLVGDGGDGGSADSGSADACKEGNEAKDFLPIHRWTSFPLSVVDNEWLLKTQEFMSEIAGLLFMVGSLLWQLIAILMGFGFTFDVLCTGAAKPVNSVAGMLAEYAAWFLIPAWLCVLAAAAKRWNGGGGKGPASAIRLLVTFFVASGMVFFLADQSAQHPDDPLAAYTAPWMAKEVQSGFATASSSMLSLGDLQGIAKSQAGDPFYDNKPGVAGAATCASLNDQLYTDYRNANKEWDRRANGVGAMEQISKIWEASFIRSWETAQFGSGTEDYPSPAHAACRMLEGVSSVAPEKKYQVYDESAGFKPGTSDKTWRGFWISPSGGYQNDEVIAWGACEQKSKGSDQGGVIDEWKWANYYGQGGNREQNGNRHTEQACNDVLLSSRTDFSEKNVAPSDDRGELNAFHFGGVDQLNGQIVPCLKDHPKECQAAYNFVNSWLGGNEAERLTQALMSLITAVIFLTVLGPMSIGLMFVSIALALLVMVFGLTLLLVAIGNDSGKRLLKLTGAAAAGKFLFTLALTFLMLFIAVTYAAINGLINSTTPNIVQETLQAAAPLVAMKCAKMVFEKMGLGKPNFTGLAGFAGAAALKATGDPRLSRGAAERVSGGIGKLGVGKKRLSSLDERSIQSRMVNNKVTRAAGRLAARGAGRGALAGGRHLWGLGRSAAIAGSPLGRFAGRFVGHTAGWAGGHLAHAAAPVTDLARRAYEAAASTEAAKLAGKGAHFVGETGQKLHEFSKSHVSATRAIGYGAATAGMLALSAAIPPAMIVTVPLMAAAGLKSIDSGVVAGTHLLDRLHPAQSVLQDAGKEVTSFPRNEVERPGGGRSTPEELRNELRGEADMARFPLKQLEQLLSRQGSMAPQEIAERKALTDQVNGHLNNVGALTTALVDAMRSHEFAGNLIELNADLDGGKVDHVELTDRYLEAPRQQWDDVIKNLNIHLDGVDRSPNDPAAITDIKKSLRVVQDTIDGNFERQKKLNTEVMHQLEQQKTREAIEQQRTPVKLPSGKDIVKSQTEAGNGGAG